MNIELTNSNTQSQGALPSSINLVVRDDRERKSEGAGLGIISENGGNNKEPRLSIVPINGNGNTKDKDDDDSSGPDADVIDNHLEKKYNETEYGEAAMMMKSGGNLAFMRVCLTCMGVIYGDIGTSPLYTVGACVTDLLNYTDTIVEDDILGIASLLFWSITLVPTIQYCFFVLSATSNGQGGTFALLGILMQPETRAKLPRWIVTGLPIISLIAVSLLIGDGVITPSISVLSAIGGIQSYQPSVTNAQVVGIAIAILGLLYFCQRFGTSKIGFTFGPFTLVWFFSIAMLGIYYITFAPQIFKCLSPHYAVMYFVNHGGQSFTVLGFVILGVTGVEAMYADMGQFGASAVRYSWLLVAYPCLMLQYFGQCSMILNDLPNQATNAALVQSNATNSFFAYLPASVFWAEFTIGTIATVIASQATISGVMVIVTQAVHMGYFPRVRITHTSRRWWSRVYLPSVNLLLALTTLALTAGYQNSNNLTNIYAIDICLIIIITTLLLSLIMYYVWGWRLWIVVSWLVFYLFIDFLWTGSTLTKIVTGGYVPISFAIFVAFILNTSRSGNRRLANAEVAVAEKAIGVTQPIILPEDGRQTFQQQQELFLKMVPNVVNLRDDALPIQRPKAGSTQPLLGVFLTPNIGMVPLALIQMVQRIRTFPENILLLEIEFLTHPYATPEQRLSFFRASESGGPKWLFGAIVRIGFAEQRKLALADYVKKSIMPLIGDSFTPTYYLSQRHIRISNELPWYERVYLYVFDLLHRNAHGVSEFFHLPRDGTVEVGTIIPL